jgi:hypothetical protein
MMETQLFVLILISMSPDDSKRLFIFGFLAESERERFDRYGVPSSAEDVHSEDLEVVEDSSRSYFVQDLFSRNPEAVSSMKSIWDCEYRRSSQNFLNICIAPAASWRNNNS